MSDNFDDIFGVSTEAEKTNVGEYDDIFGINSAPKPSSSSGDFIPGVQRGVQNLQASLYGATALAGKGLEKLGAEETGQAIQDFGLEGYKRNVEEAKQYPAKHSFKDVYTGEAGIGGAIDWAQGTLGELVPSMTEAAVGAAIGSMAAPGAGTTAGALAGRTILRKSIDEIVKKSVKEGTEKAVEDQIRKQVTKQALKKLGGKVGMGAAVFPMEAGNMYADLLESHGVDAPGTAMLFGAAATALEFAGGNSKLVDTFVDALAKGSTGMAKKTAKELLTEIPKNAGEEALQESGQELMQILNTVVNTDEKLLTGKNLERLIEAGAAGVVGGGAGATANTLMSAQAEGKQFDLKAEKDKITNSKVDQIFGQGDEQATATLTDLQKKFSENSALLNDPEQIDRMAIAANIDPNDLIRQLMTANEGNKALIDGIQKRFQDQEAAKLEEKKNAETKIIEGLSPEGRKIYEAQKNFAQQREGSAISINDQITNIDKQISDLEKQWNERSLDKIKTPEERKSISDQYIELRKKRNVLLDMQKVENDNQAYHMPYTVRDQKYYEDIFGTYGKIVPSDKSAEESVNIFNDQLTSKTIADYVNYINNVKAEDRQQVLDQLMTKVAQEDNVQKITEYTDYIKNNIGTIRWDEYTEAKQRQDKQKLDIQQMVDRISKESDPVIRQKLYEQMFQQPGVKDAQESTKVFQEELLPKSIADYANGLNAINNANREQANQQQTPLTAQQQNELKQINDYADYIKTIKNRFTPEQKAVIENYWQGVKNELSLRNEEMTPGTEAFLRKRFFETKLAEIEGNVKQDTKPTSEATKQIVPSLAAQNKRQAWFKQIATELGDFVKTNQQTIQAEKPRNLPGGLSSSFNNERQVGTVPQLQTTNQPTLNKVSLADIQKVFPNQTITQSEDGTTSVQFKNGKGLTINNIQDAGNGFVSLAIETGQMSKNGKILGVTVGNKILLDQNFADNKTLWHENKHVLDNLGIITAEDDSALNKEFNKLRKQGKLQFALSTHENPIQRMVENRANMFAQVMTDREAYRNTPFGKLIQRVMDFFDKLFSFGKQTVRGLAREVESGKVYERQVGDQTISTTVPMAEQVASKWHSALENAVNGFQQKIATPDQWKGMIKGYPGIKQEELDWIGLDEWLDSKEGKVSKDELVKFIGENNVRLEEVIKGHIPANALYEALDKIDEALAPYEYTSKIYAGKLTFTSPEGFDVNADNISRANISQEVKDIFNYARSILPEQLDDPKYETYQLPGGKNYKEMLITLPVKGIKTLEQYYNSGEYAKEYGDIGIAWNDLNTYQKRLIGEAYKEKGREDVRQQDYKSGHWDEPNILTHIRFNERIDADGNKVLFLEEVQSDWHQEGRKTGYQGTIDNSIDTSKWKIERKVSVKGDRPYINVYDDENELIDSFRGEYTDAEVLELAKDSYRNNFDESFTSSNRVPDAPFKKSWPLLAMKRMIRYAAENGFDKIAWTTGQQQADRYGEANINAEGMKVFYDQMLPSMLNKEFNRGKWGNAKVEIIESNLQEDRQVTKEEALKAYDDDKMVFVGNQIAALKSEIEQYQGTDITTTMPTRQLAIPITNRMKSKALREGMPMFEVREAQEQKISDEVYDQMYAEQNSLARSIGQMLRMRGTEVKQLVDKYMGSSYTRLKNINEKVAAEYRNIDFWTGQVIVDALRKAHPMLEKTKQMDSKDKFVWNEARKAGDRVKMEQIANKYNLTQDWQNVRTVLDNIRDEAEKVGFNVGYIEEYWPRIIKDVSGFLTELKGISEWPIFSQAIKKQADKIGMTVEDYEKNFPEATADIINNMILGRSSGIGGPGNIQERVYDVIPPELTKYYMDSDAALMSYIYSMTKKIEARKFFGKVPENIGRLKAEKKRKGADLIKYQGLLKDANGEENVNYAQRITELKNDLIDIEKQLDKFKFQRDFTENIGAYIAEIKNQGHLDPDHEKTLRDILTARFTEHGTTGLVTAYKNAAYIDVLGSPLSALTQIGDQAWAMYVAQIWTPRGLGIYAKNLAKAVSGSFDATKKMFGGSTITKEDLGLERIAQEFADGTTLSNAVSKVFKLVQFERMDSIGKEVLINSAFDQYKYMASSEAGRTQLMKKLRPVFGTQSDSVINDLIANNPSDNVKLLLYHRVLDFQPVALSAMPAPYLNGGNGRVAYMLKTYTLHQFDVFRREAWHNIRDGYDKENKAQVIEGITNMVKLASLLVLANASADEIKDWMLGKETKFEDHVIENFLTLGGASKYVRMQTAREGLGSGLMGQIMPPFRFVNSISKDLNEGYDKYVAGDTYEFDHARIVESIPGLGKLYYWHYGRGTDHKKSSNEQEFSKIGKETDLFKRQLTNAEDKRTFLNANLDKFKQMKLHENFQASLNRNQAVINKLKKIEQTTNVRERLGQLQMQREMILDKYFEVAKMVQ